MANKKKNDAYVRCDVCQIRLNYNCWEQHINGKRHLETFTRQHSLNECVRRSLFVAGLPTGTTKFELIDYFSKFASVSEIFMDKKENKYAIVELSDQLGADRIFCQNHFFKNSRLTVKRRSLKAKTKEKSRPNDEKKNKSCVDMDDIKLQLISAADFEEQIITTQKLMALSERELNAKMEVCKTMENLMKEFFPYCQAVPYGSNVSCLGTVGCDLDMYLDLKISCNRIDETSLDDELKILDTLRKNLKHYKQNASEEFINQVESLHPKRIVQLLSTIIKKYFSGCKNVIPIKSTRCPIVTFAMEELGFECDVSIKSGLGVYNSLLIASYCKHDLRVSQLLFTIRVWAKQAGVCDPKSGRFSSYAITMLGLFYLQNCQPPVIPTVETLQSLQEPPIISNNWECQFCMDATRIPQQSNTQSIGDLFKEFFEFFSHHSLSGVVVSLKMGKFIPKEEFICQIKTNEKISDFKLNTFNIQDQFELNYNLAANLVDQTTTDWNAAVAAAHTFCCNSDELTKKEDDQSWGLAKLLFDLYNPPTTVIQKYLQKRQVGNMTDIRQATTSECDLTVETNDLPMTQDPSVAHVQETPIVDNAKNCVAMGTLHTVDEVNGGSVNDVVKQLISSQELSNGKGLPPANVTFGPEELIVADVSTIVKMEESKQPIRLDGTKMPSLLQDVSANYPIKNKTVGSVHDSGAKLHLLATPSPFMSIHFPPPVQALTQPKCNVRFQPYSFQNRSRPQMNNFGPNQDPHSSSTPSRHSIDVSYFDNYMPPQISSNNDDPSVKAVCEDDKRVTPSKPRLSRITPISEKFEIVICLKKSSCMCVLHARGQENSDGSQTQIRPQRQACNLWSYDIMHQILSVALRINCEVLSDVKETDNNVNTPFLILCTVYNNTWVDRKAARAAVAVNGFNPIVSEGEVSDYLIKKYPPLTKDPLFICHCLLIGYEDENQVKLNVHLDLITTMNKEFKNFVVFLKSLSQKIFNNLMVARQLLL